jgi:hypothetical protein
MTDDLDRPTPGGSPVPEMTREEAQKRIEEILRKEDHSGGGARAPRSRTALLAILVVIILLLCGVGAVFYQILVPGSSRTAQKLEGDASTAGIVWVRSIYGWGPAASQQFANPNDAATGPDGIVWVADPGNNQVVGFRGDGTYVQRILGSRDTGKPYRTPSRIAVDPEGILYIVDRPSESLTIMDGDTKLVSSSIPGITTVDANAEITVVGSQSGFAILDKDGNARSVVGSRGNGADQFDSVGGVAIDSASKSIYVVDTYNNRLSSWDFAGKRKWIVKLGNPANDVKLKGGMSLVTTTSAPARLQLPTDVTIDGKGRPMVLDAFDFSISAFDPANGKFVGKWGTYGEKDGQFMYPSAFSYDAAKDWFVVADTGNTRAEIVRIPGTSAPGVAGVSTGLSRFMAGPARALWPCLLLLPLLLIFALVRRLMARRSLEAGEGGQDPDAVEAGAPGSNDE